MSSHLRPLVLALPMFLLAPAAFAAAPSAEEAARRYFQAENTFDQKALADVLHSRFVEVSPLGEVDAHDAVLSFYAPEKKAPAPVVKVGDIATQSDGTTAAMTTRVSFDASGRTMQLTVGLVAVRGKDGWRLLSAQYTPYRPKPPSH